MSIVDGDRPFHAGRTRRREALHQSQRLGISVAVGDLVPLKLVVSTSDERIALPVAVCIAHVGLMLFPMRLVERNHASLMNHLRIESLRSSVPARSRMSSSNSRHHRSCGNPREMHRSHRLADAQGHRRDRWPRFSSACLGAAARLRASGVSVGGSFPSVGSTTSHARQFTAQVPPEDLAIDGTVLGHGVGGRGVSPCYSEILQFLGRDVLEPTALELSGSLEWGCHRRTGIVMPVRSGSPHAVRAGSSSLRQP